VTKFRIVGASGGRVSVGSNRVEQVGIEFSPSRQDDRGVVGKDQSTELGIEQFQVGRYGEVEHEQNAGLSLTVEQSLRKVEVDAAARLFRVIVCQGRPTWLVWPSKQIPRVQVEAYAIFLLDAVRRQFDGAIKEIGFLPASSLGGLRSCVELVTDGTPSSFEEATG